MKTIALTIQSMILDKKLKGFTFSDDLQELELQAISAMKNACKNACFVRGSADADTDRKWLGEAKKSLSELSAMDTETDYHRVSAMFDIIYEYLSGTIEF